MNINQEITYTAGQLANLLIDDEQTRTQLIERINSLFVLANSRLRARETGSSVISLQLLELPTQEATGGNTDAKPEQAIAT